MGLEVHAAGTKLLAADHRRMHGRLTECRYVHSDGDDALDGLTWGTAKDSILAAYDSLPSTGGTIYIAGTNVSVGGEVANQGIWIAGFQDSASGSLPAGWRGNKRCNFIGVGGAENQSFSKTPQVGISAGSGTDRNKPALWINGINNPVHFENLYFRTPAVVAKLGIDSTTGSRSTGNTMGMSFKNVGMQPNQVAGNGPVIDAGQFYWTYFDNFTAGAVRATYALTAATIIGGTTARFTTSITHAFAVGDTVDIRGVTPTAYNNSTTIRPWTITAVTSTTFDADIGSSPADGSAFGTARPVKHSRSAIIYAPELVTFTMRDSMMSGGGIHLGGPGPAPTNIELNNVLKEGNFGSWWDPPLYYVQTGLGSQAAHYIVNCSTADSLSQAAVDVPLNQDPKRVMIVGSFISVKGPVTILGNSLPVDGPLSAGRAHGIWQGRLYGQTDAARRNFAPQAVRFANVADQNTANWSGKAGSATVTTGKSAPDGSTNAAELTSGSGNQNRRVANIGVTLAVGDWVLGGCWVRRSMVPTVTTTQGGFVIGSVSSNNLLSLSGVNTVGVGPPLGTLATGSGEWYWVWFADKFSSVGTPSTNLVMDLTANSTEGAMTFFAPVMFRIAAGTLSDSEILDYAPHMGTWPDTATAGTVTTLRGQKLVAWAGLGVGNSAAATTPGSVVRKMEVFSETGASLGFVPIYSSIT